MAIKLNKMPTTVVLSVLSWVIPVFGLAGCILVVIFRLAGPHSLIAACFILLMSLILAAVARAIGIIGQILFDLKASVDSLPDCFISLKQELNACMHDQTRAVAAHLQELNYSSQGIDVQLRDQTKTIQAIDTQLRDQARTIAAHLQELNYSSQGIDNNLNQIKLFFEQIEKHLDLKK